MAAGFLLLARLVGLANIGGGLSGTFVVNGSPTTKPQMVDSAGGRTQLALLMTAAAVTYTDGCIELSVGSLRTDPHTRKN